MSAQLDTQIASVEAALETSSKIKILRGKVEELLDNAFPSNGYCDGYDLVDEAMEFFRLGVEDVLLERLPWCSDETEEGDIHARKDFLDDLGCPFEISESRDEDPPYVLDELISEAHDGITNLEAAAFIAEAREEIEGGPDEQ